MQDCANGSTGSIAKVFAQLGVGMGARCDVVHECGLLDRGVSSGFAADGPSPNSVRCVFGELDLQLEHEQPAPERIRHVERIGDGTGSGSDGRAFEQWRP